MAKKDISDTLAEKMARPNTSASNSKHPIDTFVGYQEGTAVSLPLDRIRPDPDQPRKTFDEESIESLAGSIKEKGLLQPISVRRVDDGFILVAGERRYRAHQRAEFDTIKAFIINVDDPNEAYEISLVENLQRENLSPFEEAAGVAELKHRKNYTQSQIGAIIGRSKTQVSRLFNLNQIPDEVKEKVASSQLSRDHLFQIAAQEHPEDMLKLYEKIVKLGLTGPETRALSKEGADIERKPHPLLGRLHRFKKALNRAYSDELSELVDEERKEVSELLEALREEIERVQRSLWDDKDDN